MNAGTLRDRIERAVVSYGLCQWRGDPRRQSRLFLESVMQLVDQALGNDQDSWRQRQVEKDAAQLVLANQVEQRLCQILGIEWPAPGQCIETLAQQIEARLGVRVHQFVPPGAFIILPVDGPTDTMTQHESYIAGQWSRRNYGAIMEAALDAIKR